MEAVKEVVPGAKAAVSYLSHSFSGLSPAFAATPEYSRYPKLPFFRTQDNVCVTRWKLTWRERLRLAFTGSIWHSVSLANVNFQPFHLHVLCPLTVKKGTTIATVNTEGQKLQLEVRPETVSGLESCVIMSSRGMLDDLAEAVVAAFVWDGLTVTIRGHRELGEFETEDDALAAFARHLRQKNKGKARPSA